MGPLVVPLQFPTVQSPPSAKRQRRDNQDVNNDPHTRDECDEPQVPEWAMIELNGELLHPSDRSIPSTTTKGDNNDNQESKAALNSEVDWSQHVELGSLWFDPQDQVCSFEVLSLNSLGH